MPSARLEDCNVGVRVDADLGGDFEPTAHDLPRWQVGVLDQGPRGGERVRAARPNRENAIVRLDDVAGAGDYEAVLPVSDCEQSLETTQHTIAPPIFGQL